MTWELFWFALPRIWLTALMLVAAYAIATHVED
jgi:hypothetical protein